MIQQLYLQRENQMIAPEKWRKFEIKFLKTKYMNLT